MKLSSYILYFLLQHQALETDASLCKNVYTNKNTTVPIHKLQILHAIPRSELCESVLFGIPLIVVPTACWTIDWKELDQNQNNFNALCDELVKKDQVLLLRMFEENTLFLNAKVKPVMASGYFILMSSERNLLIKSVISEELLLPSNRQQFLKQTSLESELRIQASLSQLNICSSYNPLKFNAGLFEALKQSSLPKKAKEKDWNPTKKKIQKRNIKTTTQTGKSILPSPPKFPKTILEPGQKHTATVWSSPLSNVVKKATKMNLQEESMPNVSGVKLNRNLKTSWKPGFVED